MNWIDANNKTAIENLPREVGENVFNSTIDILLKILSDDDLTYSVGFFNFDADEFVIYGHRFRYSKKDQVIAFCEID